MATKRTADAPSWLDRYHDYERRCTEAADLSDGPERDQAFEKCHEEHAALMAEPDAFPLEPAPSPEEEIKAKILVAWFYASGDARRDWGEWIDRGMVGEIPPARHAELERLAGRLAWHRDAESGGDATTEDDASETGNNAEHKGKAETAEKARINARMIDAIQKDPDAVGWTISKWTAHLGCSRDGVHRTPTWKTLQAEHVVAKVNNIPAKRRGDKPIRESRP